MEVTELIELIPNVGFAGVMCYLMWKLCTETLKENTSAIAELKETVVALTTTVSNLVKGDNEDD